MTSISYLSIYCINKRRISYESKEKYENIVDFYSIVYKCEFC